MARTKSLLGLGAAISAAVTICTMGTAYADLAPTPTDAVGVGSDTVQNIGNFLADGDATGDPGFNFTGPKNRLVSFDATPDENDRAGYLNGSTITAPVVLNPTIILRRGLHPVLRPNGSGKGIAALIADHAHKIDFVRMSRPPKSTEITAATNSAGVGALRTIKISDDDIELAVGTTTNAPTGATSLAAADIVNIFKCASGATNWSAFGGTAGTIIPEVPQDGSGTGDTFKNDLVKLNGGNAVTLGTCVVRVEENDPSTLTSPNAIVPFSVGRKNLYDGTGPAAGNPHYFNDPTIPFCSGTTTGSTPQCGAGAAPVPLSSNVQFTSGSTYTDHRGLYIVFRDSDTTSGTKFEPGSALNLVQTLFYNPTNVAGFTPFVEDTGGQAVIQAAGENPDYEDCGSATIAADCT